MRQSGGVPGLAILKSDPHTICWKGCLATLRVHWRPFAVKCLLATLLQNDPFPFELGALEVEDNANFQAGNAQVVQHLATLMVCDVINHFRVDYHRVERNEVRYVFTYVDGLVGEIESWLLTERYS